MIRKKPADPEKLRLKMADLCARSEQCENDIREKLRRALLSPAKIDEIISFLTDRHFIDNSRYARSFTNDKVRFAGWGRNKIRQALRLKRIPSDIIDNALENIDEKEYNQSLMRIAKNKAKDLDLDNYQEKIKLYRHLLARGFESAKISKVISILLTRE